MVTANYALTLSIFIYSYTIFDPPERTCLSSLLTTLTISFSSTYPVLFVFSTSFRQNTYHEDNSFHCCLTFSSITINWSTGTLPLQVLASCQLITFSYAGINLTGYHPPPRANCRATNFFRQNLRPGDSFSVQNSGPRVEK